MQTHLRIWRYLQRHRALSIVLGHVCVLLVLATLFFGSSLGSNILGVFAQSHCSSGDKVHVVKSGDTLGGIAASYNTSWQSLASYNHIANPNVIYINETICIPGKTAGTSGSGQPVKGGENYFPYGECTWWASNRYHQFTGIYVPWTSQANAWQWTARARQFHWKVSSRPSYAAIVDLQPWVQGAYGLGHVAVVEKILKNGHVIASNLNWGSRYWQVTYVEFAPGPGVTFLTF
jgi:N-acetylmuramoyl-L-alanine amidase